MTHPGIKTPGTHYISATQYLTCRNIAAQLSRRLVFPPPSSSCLDEQWSGAAHRLDNGEREATLPHGYQAGTHTPAWGVGPKRRRRFVGAPKTHFASFV